MRTVGHSILLTLGVILVVLSVLLFRLVMFVVMATFVVVVWASAWATFLFLLYHHL